MHNFSLYYKIDNMFLKDEKMLKEELKIDLNIKKCVPFVALSLVDEIYKNCFEQLYYFSLSGIDNQINSSLKSIIFDKNLPVYEYFENMIKEHCVITSLLTIQNLMYEKYEISATRLFLYCKKSGHNSLINKYGIQGNTLNFKSISSYSQESYKMDINSIPEYPNKKDKKIKNNETFNDISVKFYERKNKKDTMLSFYLSQCIDIKIEEIKIKKKTAEQVIVRRSAKVPLVLSNLSYCILYNLYNIEQWLINIRNLEGYKKTEKVREFNENYMKFVNKLNFDNNSSTKVDKYLFYYVKERLFHVDMVNYFYSLLEYKIPNDCINYFKTCMKLPNALSRLNFIIKPEVINEADYSQNISIINKLVKLTFPLFEKSFFITLYRYCEKYSKGKELETMNNILTSYVNNRMPDFNKTSVSKIEGSIKVSKNKQKESRDKAYYIFDLLEHIFYNVNPYNQNINSDYRFVFDEKQKYIEDSLLKNKDEKHNYAAKEFELNRYRIFNDYMSKTL